MSLAVSKFITDLAMHFPPKHAKPEAETAWVRSMAEALRGYDASTLNDAARKIIASRTYATFPLPADCRKACDEAQAQRRVIELSKTLPEMRPFQNDDWSSERQRLAYDLVKCGMGKEAARSNWVLSLWNFCRQNQRLPQGREIDQCKKVAKEFDDLYEDLVRGTQETGWLGNPIIKFADSMRARREKIRTEVLGA